MDSAVIHHDDVVAPECRNQALLNIGKEERFSFMAPSITIGAVILLWRKAATKVIVCHDPSGTVPITLTPFGARPFESRQVRADRSLVDKHQPGGIKKTLLSYPTPACARHICSLPFGSLQGFFLEGDVVAIEKTPERAAAGSNSLSCAALQRSPRASGLDAQQPQPRSRPQTLQAAKHFRRSASARRCYHRASAAAI